MNEIQALHELLKQAASTKRLTVASYKRAAKAVRVLRFNTVDAVHPLSFLGYCRSDTGEPYEWLRAALAAREVK